MHTTLFAMTCLFQPPSDFETATVTSVLPSRLIVIFPFPLTAYQGLVNPKSRLLSPDRRSALAGGMLNARRTERPTGGDDRIEIVRIKPVLGSQRGLGGCVERDVAGAVEDEVPMLTRKGGSEWVEFQEA